MATASKSNSKSHASPGANRPKTPVKPASKPALDKLSRGGAGGGNLAKKAKPRR